MTSSMGAQARHLRAKEIVADALERGPDHRSVYVAEACAGDATLLAEVESLLQFADTQADAFSDDALIQERARLNEVLDSETRPLESSGPARQDTASYSAEVPVRVGRYQVVRLVGEGGMGRVFEALQDHPRRRVAIKLIRASHGGAALIRRFEFEAQALGRLEHPGIARIYEAGVSEVVLSEKPRITAGGPQPFMAMEFVEGEPLDAYARRAGLGIKSRLQLLARVCLAVNHAHLKGVIHRDLKPNNILVVAEGDPKVLDFGVARFVAEDAEARHTATGAGQLIGTPAYMSPEQFTGGTRSADAASDVYALGVIAYELLGGRRPHEPGDSSIIEFGRRICDSTPQPLGRIDRSLAGDVETIVAKALAIEPQQRYESAAAMAADIQRFLDNQPVLARPQTTIYHLRKFARRHRAVVISSLVAVAALIGGLVVSTSLYFKADRQVRIAEAVNEFLNVDLLSAPQPRALGIDATMRDVLAVAAQRVEGRFADQPEVEAAVRMAIGQSYQNLGAYDQAEPHLQRSVALRRKALGHDDPDTLIAMNNLAALYYMQGRFEELEELTREVLNHAARPLGPEHPITLTATNNLGRAIYRRGDYAAAERIFKENIERSRRAFGQDSEWAIQITQNLAIIYSQQGRKQEAADLSMEVWQSFDRRHGPQHPDTINNAANYATMLLDLDRSAEAEPVLQAALRASVEVFGPNHTDTLYTMNALANVLDKLERYEEAEQMFIETLARRREALGTSHTSTVSSLIGLAKHYFRRQRFDDALPFAREAAEVNRSLATEPNYKTVVIDMLLADIYVGRGEQELAVSAAAAAVAAARQVGDSPQRLANALVKYGTLLQGSDPPTALKSLEEAREILTRQTGLDHEEVTQLDLQIAHLQREPS